jgi:hypothetical protein
LRFAWLLCLLLVLGSPASAEGDADATAAPGWEFSLAPYLWGSAIEGTVEADDVSADVDVSFSDILDALDVGVLGSFEARRGKLSLTSNLVYLKLSTDAERPVGPGLGAFPPGSLEADVEAQSLIFEGRGTWEVFSVPLFGDGDERRLALDLGPAFRLWWLDQEIDVELRPGVPLGPFASSSDESMDWVDFLAAARVRAQLTEKLALAVSGDYGGFDIGSSAHRTWSLGGFFAYRLGEHWDLALGWRTLELERGAADVELSGPLFGANYRF